MTRTNTAVAAPSSKKKKARVAIGILGVLAVGGVGASALWSDTAQVETTVTAGTLNINVDGDEGNPTPYVIDLPVTEFAPGTTTTKALTVNNTGTVPVSVDLSTSAEGGATGLASALRTDVKVGAESWITAAPLNAASFTDKVIQPGASAVLDVTVSAPTNMVQTQSNGTDKVLFNFVADQFVG